MKQNKKPLHMGEQGLSVRSIGIEVDASRPYKGLTCTDSLDPRSLSSPGVTLKPRKAATNCASTTESNNDR